MAIDDDMDEGGPRRSRPVLRGLLLAGVAFAAGAAAMGYVLTHWDLAATYLAGRAATPVAVVTTPAPAPVAAIRTLPGVEARVAEIEARIGAIGARANAAVGNADRAEGLLVAFAARRALDRGVQLGYIEALLRERFGPTQPQAVATIIAAGRQPVTLEDLQQGLDDIGPRLALPGPEESWWDGLRREVAGLVIVRKADTPSPAPADRLARAIRQIDAGHVAAALAEVARMPGRANGREWIARARRYAAARDALDVIETAALLEPRNLARPPQPVAPPPADPGATAPVKQAEPKPAA